MKQTIRWLWTIPVVLIGCIFILGYEIGKGIWEIIVKGVTKE